MALLVVGIRCFGSSDGRAVELQIERSRVQAPPEAPFLRLMFSLWLEQVLFPTSSAVERRSPKKDRRSGGSSPQSGAFLEFHVKQEYEI
jgi:hypothetical protein